MHSKMLPIMKGILSTSLVISTSSDMLALYCYQVHICGQMTVVNTDIRLNYTSR